MVYDGQMKRGAGNVGTVLDGNDGGERVAVRGVWGGCFLCGGESGGGGVWGSNGAGGGAWCVGWGSNGAGGGAWCVGWESRMFAGWVCPAKRGQMPCGIWWINGWRVSVEKMLKERLARAVVGN